MRMRQIHLRMASQASWELDAAVATVRVLEVVVAYHRRKWNECVAEDDANNPAALASEALSAIDAEKKPAPASDANTGETPWKSNTY